MTAVTINEWLERVSALKISQSHGKPAAYQPLMLMAALIYVARRPVRQPRLTESALRTPFEQLKQEICPNAGAPDTLAMPIGALGKAGVWEFQTALGTGLSLSAGYSQGRRGRELMELADHVVLPEAVVEFVRRSEDHLRDLIVAVANRHRLTLEASGFAGLDFLSNHWLLKRQEDAEPDSNFGAEADVEEALCDSWDSKPFAQQYGFRRWQRQFSTRLGRLDVLARRGVFELLVVEIKHGDPHERAVSQVGRYMEAAATTPPHNAAKSKVQGLILTNQISDRLLASVRGLNRVGLWRYDGSLNIEHVAGPALT